MIELHKVSAHYGKVQVLYDINVKIEGSVGIVGPNGSGKSTLCKVIAGLKRPSSGTILYNGKDITDLQAPERVRIGIVLIPERGGVLRRLTVEENLKLASRVSGSDIKKAYDLFPLLRERRKQVAGTLSGGEQRMLALASALLMNPKVLILDEPSLGLAPKVKLDLIRWINLLKKNNIDLLITEQDPSIVLGTASKVYLIKHGRLQEVSLNDLKNMTRDIIM